MPDYLHQLRRQVGYIHRSCVLYDAGHLDEALRIAVSLRVLLHDTKRSTSLFAQLGIKDSARLLTTFEPGYAEDKKTGLFSVSVPLWIDNTGDRKAPLDNVTRRDFVPVSEWWTEVIMCMNHKLSRKDVVLAAANQDGGAHVESKPSAETLELKTGIGTFTSVNVHSGQITKRLLDNHHFPLLRQFAYEVLNSPDIKTK